MLALFRCDASPTIGAGHVSRCLAIAEEFSEAGWDVAFAVRPETISTVPGLAASGFAIEEIDETDGAEAAALGRRYSSGVDLLVVDHYGRDVSFERSCRAFAHRILVLDDGTGRVHDCDLLVDAAATTPGIYSRLVPEQARVLAGPTYALMRRTFVSRRQAALQRRDGRQVDEILLSFGATDPRNATQSALAALDPANRDVLITVAMSARAPHVEAIRGQLTGRARLVLDGDIASLMTEADLAIGAAGGTSFERAVLGLPSIVVIVAENQRGLCRLLVQSGAAADGGELDEAFPKRLARLTESLLRDGNARVRMAKAASSLVDGGGARRLLMAVAGEA